MITETTSIAELIEWLWHDKEDPWSEVSVAKAEAIRAQLLAGQEMARVLKMISETHSPWSSAAKERIIAWHKAGGE